MQYTPENTIHLEDLDDFVINMARGLWPRLVLGGMYLEPTNSMNWIKSLYKILKMRSKRGPDGKKERLKDKYGNPIDGVTFQLLYYGMQDENLRSYVPWMLETIDNLRSLDEKTIKILEDLKYKKGYKLIAATNKDRVSYDASAKKFGKKFTDLFDQVCVAQPGINSPKLQVFKEFLATTKNLPANYEKLLRQAINVEESDNIHHIEDPKPSQNYYKRVLDIARHYIGKNIENVFFTDDKQKNIDGFHNAFKDELVNAQGIRFKNPVQLAQELVKYGVFSEKDDQTLLDEIGYNGYINQLVSYGKKLVGSGKPQTQQ